MNNLLKISLVIISLLSASANAWWWDKEEEVKEPAKEVVKLSAELFTANTTLKQWADWYILEMDLVHNLSSSHINRTRKGFKKDLFPAVGDKNMNDVTTQEIADILSL